MAVLFLSTDPGEADRYRPLLEAELPEMEIRAWPETGRLEDIRYAVIGPPAPGVLAELPNLKAVLSTWAGIDAVLADPSFPRAVPLARLVDPLLTLDMVQFAVHWVLHFHRNIPRHLENQRAARWEPLDYPEATERRIGVMGLGALGGAVARHLATLGFDVAGWTRQPRDGAGMTVFAGADGLMPFLARSEILVNLLPLTGTTHGVLNARTLGTLPRGGYLINMARGAHVVEADLLDALDSGQLAGAALDVFETEPLPSDHPFWRHPRIHVTPHVASATTPRTAAREVAIDIRRLEAGQSPRHPVDPERGY